MLIQRLRASDEEAIEALVRLHGPQLIKYATRILRSGERAQEIVQDVFFHLWAERAHLTDTRNLSVYLFWLTRNRAIDAVRADWAARQREGRWVMDTGAESAFVLNTGDADLEAAETRVEVWESLASVPPRCREIFMMAWDQQLSYHEIAQRLGISVPTVRSQASRALKRLLEVLGPRFIRSDR
jgi:RNA polymerase sigma-70 factor (ECF subfamily)